MLELILIYILSLFFSPWIIYKLGELWNDYPNFLVFLFLMFMPYMNTMLIILGTMILIGNKITKVTNIPFTSVEHFLKYIFRHKDK